MNNSNNESILADELNKLFSINESLRAGNVSAFTNGKPTTLQDLADINANALSYIADYLEIELEEVTNPKLDCGLVRKDLTKGEKISRALSKDVFQFDLFGNLLNSFHGVNEASRLTGVDQSNISKCCRGKLNQTGGFLWRFANDQ